MSDYVFSIADRVTLPIAGKAERFPVGRIFCVGRNYAAHAREMGADPDREPPFFFAKPADCVITGEKVELKYPPRTSDLHHEVELVVGLKSGGTNIPVSNALDTIYGAAVGIEFTRRDLQGMAKKAGRPWEMGKGFDGASVIAPMSAVTPDTMSLSGTVSLDVNGDKRQSGDLSDMIWSIAETISELSTYLTLKSGDLIFTGTPEGVGAVGVGDKMAARIEGFTSLEVEIV